MADYKLIIPFIKGKEGGLSKALTDVASADPLPDGSGYHTNKGITWTTFKGLADLCQYEATPEAFYAMEDDVWGRIFKYGFWDGVYGDQIESQRIAEEMAEWAWGSGRYYPSLHLQNLLIKYFQDNIGADGSIGAKTVACINSANEPELFKYLVRERIDFICQIVVDHPQQAVNLLGWINRQVELLFTEI